MNLWNLLFIVFVVGAKLRLLIVLVLLLIAGLNHKVTASPKINFSDFGRSKILF